ncbi:hypothetical protein FS749_012072 [Ceratobasidium sp. UAMH 11750]|nr:hypothetical protein FS749_012072 [Ceratobasidium sp. UAMH 11750]
MPPQISSRKQRACALVQFMIFCEIVYEEEGAQLSAEEEEDQLLVDLVTYYAIMHTRYLAQRVRIPRVGNIHVLWEYARDPVYHHLFIKLVRVAPRTFYHILAEIEENLVFCNNSAQPQTPVEIQLAVALYRLGRYGNGASFDDVAFLAGIGHGTVALFTRRIIKALLDIHGIYVRLLTDEERIQEREWVLERMGCPEFAPGIYQYDGFTVPLWQKPGLNGDAYYSRHGCYEMNVQVGCIGSHLRITDYSVGSTGSAHDALAFRTTAAYRYPHLIFKNDEFAWADSAYTASYRIIPIHKAPANREPRVRAFDKAVSHLRVRSEHCNGLVKGRWQSLPGLWILINRRRDHVAAMDWISACIVLHNICVDVGDEEWDEMDMPEVVEHEEPGAELAGGERRSLLVEAYQRYRRRNN